MGTRFCLRCGNELAEDACFCDKCGASVKKKSGSYDTGEDKRRTVFEGVIHKCPNCGEVLNAFIAECPTCGYELRGSRVSEMI